MSKAIFLEAIWQRFSESGRFTHAAGLKKLRQTEMEFKEVSNKESFKRELAKEIELMQKIREKIPIVKWIFI